MAGKWRAEGLALGDVVAKPGEKKTGKWPVAPRSDGSAFELPVMLCCGAQDGPVLWVHGCIHGDEYAGSVGIMEVFQNADPAKLRGGLIAIPVLNISAFESNGRSSPLDNLDMNRVFPGDAKGTHTRRAAYAIMEAALAKADCLMDMHGYRSHHMSLYFAAGNEATERARGLAVAAGTDAVVKSAERWLEGSVCAQLTKAGVPAIIVEAPGGGRLERPNIDRHVVGITNVMKHLGMVDGELVPPARPSFLCSVLQPIPAPTSGLVLLEVKRGERVSRGQLLARMVDVYGQVTARVESPVDGMVLNMDEHGLLYAGEPLFMLGAE